MVEIVSCFPVKMCVLSSCTLSSTVKLTCKMFTMVFMGMSKLAKGRLFVNGCQVTITEPPNHVNLGADEFSQREVKHISKTE